MLRCLVLTPRHCPGPFLQGCAPIDQTVSVVGPLAATVQVRPPPASRLLCLHGFGCQCQPACTEDMSFASACKGPSPSCISNEQSWIFRPHCLQDCALMYGLMANTGQEPGQAPPAVMLPSSCSGGSSSPEGGDKPLAGKTAGVCSKVLASLSPYRRCLWVQWLMD